MVWKLRPYVVVKNPVGNHASVPPLSGDLQNWIAGALGHRLCLLWNCCHASNISVDIPIYNVPTALAGNNWHNFKMEFHAISHLMKLLLTTAKLNSE